MIIAHRVRCGTENVIRSFALILAICRRDNVIVVQISILPKTFIIYVERKTSITKYSTTNYSEMLLRSNVINKDAMACHPARM